jgi:hypothetical protein
MWGRTPRMTPDPDTHSDSRYVFLASPWRQQFAEVVGQATREVFVVSPFVNLGGVKILTECVAQPAALSLTLLTSVTPRGAADRTTDPEALAHLYRHFGQVRISSLGALHAKVYAIDGHTTIISSANLTTGGLKTNFEYGVLIRDRTITAKIRQDTDRYYALGNTFDRSLVELLQQGAEELRTLQTLADSQLSGTLARRVQQVTTRMKMELLKNRTKGGRTANAIFSDTILRILADRGPLSTRELHGIIQPLHPDMCDDSIDRVINGERFGRKWKHLVRSAQQSLKRTGRIDRHGARWHLIG